MKATAGTRPIAAAAAVILYLSGSSLRGAELDPQDALWRIPIGAPPVAAANQAPPAAAPQAGSPQPAGEKPAEEPKPPVVKVGAEGFSLESGDGAFQMRLRTLVQGDSRLFFGNDQTGTGTGLAPPSGSDDFLIRRARIELTGKLFKQFDFRLMPDFAPATSTLLDAWLRWTVKPSLQFMAGKVKLPVGLEREQTREFNLFNEFAYPTSLVPNRDIGFIVQGQVAKALNYYVGAFNGSSDGASLVDDTDDGKTAVARLFLTPTDGPLEGLGVGIAATDGEQQGIPSSYRTIGQQIFWQPRTGVLTDGGVSRLEPQLYYFRGPFGLMSEWVTSQQELRLGTTFAELEHEAWQVSVTWVLTGEDATYRGVKPAHNVDTKNGQWGAWQLVARVTELDVDDDSFPIFADPASSSTKASTFGIGLHWIMNQMVRVTVDYNGTDLDGGSLEDEDVVIGRVQLRI
jgi:phosphate-selective porin OprO/OprP